MIWIWLTFNVAFASILMFAGLRDLHQMYDRTIGELGTSPILLMALKIILGSFLFVLTLHGVEILQ